MRTGLIYKATNKKNGKVYIGQTVQKLYRRINHHIQDAKVRDLHFHRAIRKYGRDQFEWTVLEDGISQDQLNEKEVYYINQYDSLNPDYGYNMAEGGGHLSNGKAKIDADFAKIIRKDIMTTTDSLLSIAKKHNVSSHIVYCINNGKSWFDCSLEYPLRKPKFKTSKLTSLQVKEVQELLMSGSLDSDIMKEYNIALSSLHKIRTGASYFDDSLDYPLRPIITQEWKERAQRIIGLLLNTEKSHSEIANECNVSSATVTSINNGKSWPELYSGNFPIRSFKTSPDIALKIIEELKKPTLTYEQIAKLFNCPKGTVSDINNGHSFSYLHEGPYPIRDTNRYQNKVKKLSEDQVKDIIDLLQTTKISMPKIGNKYGISRSSIEDISAGRSYKYLYNGSYPIRQSKRKNKV